MLFSINLDVDTSSLKKDLAQDQARTAVVVEFRTGLTRHRLV